MGFIVKKDARHPDGALGCLSEISAPAPGPSAFAVFVRPPERTQIGLIAAALFDALEESERSFLR